jgi:two-component system cell cycle sensor histidine kinase/response regulator CckA
MKSNFPLENATWPAFLVNGSGVIVRANKAALKLFGPELEENETAPFSAIWAADNTIAPKPFLAQYEGTSAASVPARLRAVHEGSTPFSVSICSFNKDGQNFFMFQVLPETAPSPASAPAPQPTPAPAPIMEAPAGGSDTTFASAHKQKLDCALQLARTVSLDFNNALTSILGHTSLILSQMEPTHPWRRSLLEVEKSADKAAEIASDLGAFSRQEKEPRTQASGNLNAIVQRAVDLFQNSPASKLEWSLQLGRKLFSVKFDEAKMQQAFVKVLENAVQAVNAAAGSRITVHTRNVELAEPSQDQQLKLAAGTYVCVEVTDNGPGIAPEVLPRIFEPFFTTKKSGNHRGLGLAWVYGIVTNHGGGVAVSSRPGTGASVRIYLPAEKKLAHESGVDTDDLKGNQTILMVDDEDLLLTMGQTVLSAYGYEVLTASSGQQALEMFTHLKESTNIDLMITDLVMPGMSGRELVEHVRKLSPDTRVLCSSGFVRPASKNEDLMYLQKPFTSQELLVKVKEALASAVS